MRSILVLAIIALGFAGSVVSRQIGLLTYIWFALFRPLEWMWWDMRSFRLSLVAGLLFLVPCIFTGWMPNVTNPMSLLSLSFLGTVLVAHFTSYLQSSFGWVDQFIRLLVVCMLAVNLVDSKKKLSQVVAVMAGSFAFFAAKAGLFYYIDGGVQFSAGQAGAFIDNNGYAMAVNMAIPLMAATALALQVDVPYLKYLRYSFLLCIPFSIMTVIGTMSRAGLLSLGSLVLSAGMLQRRPFLWTGGMVLAGALMFTVVPLPQGYLDRMQTIQTYEEVGEGSALSRFHFWHIATVMVARNPYGVGLRRFDDAYDDHDDSAGYWGSHRSVHNSHLEVLAEMGYAGFAIWIVMFIYAFVLCLRVRYGAASLAGLSEDDRKFYITMANAFMASMFAFIIGGTFIASANNELTWLTFFVVAILHRLYRKDVDALKPVPVAADRVAAVVPRPRRQAIA
ncbi:MAG: O-antigen ligase family protein [Vicinamibacterales bacterium]